ncbi:hypothetical protein DOTSEDRAFT_75171 [Dothistroma septosporum NZE10]|uniref:SAM domain-containing protein n=1 Tax=Dothistroma septosporum (strain NZE10 / CBS 128990) TaxID=675120 RepID=M2WK97_DOTSN|nr:hypothetical protein DOTSEDRAFT_75171 [Dothistroma septosporum NZE10]
MPDITPASPLEASGEMFLRAQTAAMFDTRPLSYVTDATEILDTDIEDESDYEPVSPKDSLQSEDSRRRSQTTISSYDEAPTPSPRTSAPTGHFEPRFRPAVEGPKGPHLFRASQVSAEFDYFDYGMQMSPLLPKEQPLRTESACTEQTATPVASQPSHSFSLDNALRQPGNDHSDPMSIISSWSTQQVIDWMCDAGLDPSVIECFAQHDINGAVLVDLHFEDLKELDIPSFGKRHQLWSAICVLTGEDGHVSPTNTPFQDISRPCTAPPGRSASRRRSPSQGRHMQSQTTEDLPPTPTAGKKPRRGRKVPKTGDIVTPAESISIVAIEQLLPRQHTCTKGERCAKWRKQQRQINQLQSEHGIGRFPVSPTNGGRIFVAGDPGNAATAYNMAPNIYQPQETQTPPTDDLFRPVSEAQPSVVASSDLLGPCQLPEFALHEDMLQHLGKRDPQDNVKQFLNFQHMQSPTSDEAPPTPPYEMFPSESVSPFPAHQPQVQLQPQRYFTPGPHQQLRQQLPKLDIPRSASAGPALHHGIMSPQTAVSICRSATASPDMNIVASPDPNMIYRLGTPASEMDVPVSTLPPQDPIASRNAAQSVPPNMQYRPQQPLSRSHSRSGTIPDWRRPSMQLPAVKENEVFSPSSDSSSSKRPTLTTTNSADGLARRKTVRDPSHHSPVEAKHFGYGPDCTHAGWMKKRKAKFLHHEWSDSHFRLKGTELSQHSTAKLTSTPTDIINVDHYSVACSSVSSNNKLTAAMKALRIKEDKEKKEADPTAFAFQLIPSKVKSLEKKAESSSKTHHFAVKTKDQRIDWMREVMLAKALKQKGEGYEVEVNGCHV